MYLRSIILLLLFINQLAMAQAVKVKSMAQLSIPLYENIPNNLPDVANKESNATSGGVTRYSKISVPTITPYLSSKPNGKAVIICPGGGYSILAMNIEGNAVAKELNEMGVNAFVLKYRLPDDEINIDKSLAPLQDVQEAIRFVRKNAKKYKIDEQKIGIFGSSAGGHLAASASVHYEFKADINNKDNTSCKPNFTILLYPVISGDSSIAHMGSRNNLIGKTPTIDKINFFSNELHVNENTPPSFLIHASDDAAVSAENSLRYYQACLKNKVLAEMHIYPKGGHGFGLNNKTTKDKWIDRLRNWLNTL